jgi:hypothetical protein
MISGKDIWGLGQSVWIRRGGKNIQLMNLKLRSKLPKLYDNVPLLSVGRQLDEL